MTAEDRLHTGCSMPDLTTRAIRRFGDRLALDGHGGRLTYREIGERGSRIAQALKALGFGPGHAISVLGRSRTDGVPLSYAAQGIGMRYTALHPMGSEDDHAFILEDAEIDLLVVDEGAFLDRAIALRNRVPSLKMVLTFGPSDLGGDIQSIMSRFEPGELPSGVDPSAIAAISYTGGTTGRPKGVILRHRTLTTAVMLELAVWEWPEEIRFLSATPMSHATAMMLPPTFIRGGTFFVQEKFDSERFLAIVEQERITATFLVPTMIYRLLDHPARHRYDLSSLKMIIYGAAPMSPVRLAEALDAFGPVFCQLYGQTEAPQIVTYLGKGDHDPDRVGLLASCGTPVPGLEVAILNESGDPVEPGGIGEICVRGPLVMDGYWKRPEETAHALRGGWLHTSDMARQDDQGYYYIVDRAKDMIISGGFNVYPREVEDALQTHPDVAAAAVIGIPDKDWGEAVAAFVILRPNAAADADALSAHVRTLKGAVQAPKVVIFVESLPETPIGKIDKKALRDAYWGDADRQV